MWSCALFWLYTLAQASGGISHEPAYMDRATSWFCFVDWGVSANLSHCIWKRQTTILVDIITTKFNSYISVTFDYKSLSIPRRGKVVCRSDPNLRKISDNSSYFSAALKGKESRTSVGEENFNCPILVQVVSRENSSNVLKGPPIIQATIISLK